MQHYGAPIQQIRHAAPYHTTAGLAQPIGTVQGHARLPVAPVHAHPAAAQAHIAASPPGRVQHSHAPHIVAGPPLGVPQPVPQPPPPAVAQPAPAKIQPQLQQLPKFQPPVFEGENGALPCPDSPGSTPRSGRKSTGGRLQEALVDEETGLFLPGSTVEYKSRSSGQWIPARVESYDEANRQYRLDVQPHAHPERVRPRGSISGSASSAAVASTSAGGATASNASNNAAIRDATEAVIGSVANPEAEETISATPARPSVADVNGSPSNGAEASKAAALANADPQALLAEVNALKMQVSLLQAENVQLREQVASEVALKERYYQDLRVCHDQLNRVRGTPR
eukprot:TRINITY_DN14968_c0_g1_i1.p2 TRINITY_DN14968_c0_g1~~TRINITY_DN14968_c0_g1_i1.p2  ORF type:complete len:340 (-),score=64.69 TRINITY_DN14968_c0_g1_i1:78-1097(-)